MAHRIATAIGRAERRVRIASPVLTAGSILGTVADVAATTTWTGATVNKTFATTTAKVGIAKDNVGSYTLLAHFRLTLAGRHWIFSPRALHNGATQRSTP